MEAFGYDLGRRAFPVTTSSPEAQAWTAASSGPTATTTRRPSPASAGRSSPTRTARWAHWGIGWSLKGLHDCLRARGETAEIVQVRQRLDLAQARADRAVGASCFCTRAALRAAE